MLMNMVWRTLPGWRLCIIEGKDLTDVGSILMKVFLHAGYIPEAFLEKKLG